MGRTHLLLLPTQRKATAKGQSSTDVRRLEARVQLSSPGRKRKGGFLAGNLPFYFILDSIYSHCEEQRIKMDCQLLDAASLMEGPRTPQLCQPTWLWFVVPQVSSIILDSHLSNWHLLHLHVEMLIVPTAKSQEFCTPRLSAVSAHSKSL